MITTALLVASESLPVVDIDNTVFLQAILFLSLFVILHFLLFKPWLEVRDRRAARISGAMDEAVQLRAAAEERERDYEARLAKARDEAMDVRSESRKQAEGKEAEIVGAARSEAASELEQTKVKIAGEIDEARAQLGERVESLAGDITKQVLGRSA